MEVEILKGNEFIALGTKELLRRCNIEYKDDLKIKHICYDRNINKKFQYKMIRQIIHDGTLAFTIDAIIEMFYELAECKTLYKPLMDKVDLTKVVNVNYTIGDLKIKHEMVTTSKGFPGVREVFELPIYCELALE